jgi:hypothetical protein
MLDPEKFVDQTPSLPPPKTALQPFPVTQPKTNLLAIMNKLVTIVLRAARSAPSKVAARFNFCSKGPVICG